MGWRLNQYGKILNDSQGGAIKISFNEMHLSKNMSEELIRAHPFENKWGSLTN